MIIVYFEKGPYGNISNYSDPYIQWLQVETRIVETKIDIAEDIAAAVAGRCVAQLASPGFGGVCIV